MSNIKDLRHASIVSNTKSISESGSQITRVIILPRERLIRELMSRSFQNNEMQRLFKDLKPEQRL